MPSGARGARSRAGDGSKRMKLRQQIAITTVLAAVVAGGWAWLAGTEDGAVSRPNEGKRGAGTRVYVEPIALVPDRVIVRAVGTGEARLAELS